MTKIVQIATGHHSLKAQYEGNPMRPVIFWALLADADTTRIVGMVMDPASKQLIAADEVPGFRGYVSG